MKKMKKLQIEYDEQRSLESTVDQLQSLVDGLRAGALTVARGDRRLLFLLKPEAPLEFTLHAERAGERERIELTLEWRRQHLVIGNDKTRLQQLVATGAAAAQGTQPRDIEREDLDASDEEQAPEGSEELDEEDFDDDAETLRLNNQLAQVLQPSLEHH